MGDIRDLLGRARDSFTTVYLDCQVESDSEKLGRAMLESIPDREQRIKEGSLKMFEARPTKVEEAGDGRFRQGLQVWWRKPSSWRDEYTWDGGVTAGITTVRGPVSETYVPQQRLLYTTERRPRTGLADRLRALFGSQPVQLDGLEDRVRQNALVDPSYLASGWDLTVLDERKHAGRHALHVSAKWLGRDPEPPLWSYVHKYDLLVDRERGVLLRAAGIIEGEEVGVYSVRLVRFDEPIADELFVLEPPKGTKIIGP
jgi:hypothetical protein